MKKNLLIILAVFLMATGTRAQFPYATNWSGYTPTYSVYTGLATTWQPGFLWFGSQQTLQLGGFPWWPNNLNIFVKGIGNTGIWTGYKIFDASNGCTGTLSQVTNGIGICAVEANNSSTLRYGIAGAYNSACYFAGLSGAGAVSASMRFPFPPQANSTAPAPGIPVIVQDANTSDFFICGTFEGEIYIIRINSSGSIVWSDFYKLNGFAAAKDIVFSPLMNQLYVVGQVDAGPGDTDAFFMQVDGLTGNCNFVRTYGTVGSPDVFNTIIRGSGVTPANSGGFVIGGATQSPTTESWLLKLDVNGNIIWNNLVSPASGANNGIVDVIERLNTFSNYEYYALISSASGMVVTKMDDMGMPFLLNSNVSSNEFVYNLPAASPAIPASISQIPGPVGFSDVGIQVYGTANNWPGVASAYVVSAYFNGETNCFKNLLIQNTPKSGPSGMKMHPFSQRPGLGSCNNFVVQALLPGGTLNFPCAGVMLNGNNQRALPTGVEEIEGENNSFGVRPNPVADKAIITYNAQENETVAIDLYNLLGEHVRTIQSGKTNTSGTFTEEVDFNNLLLEKGVYLVTLNLNGYVQKQKVIYTK
jgi:hypothetical protein